jgi:hypothetical protein
VIAVPTITLEGDANGALHPDSGAYAKKFSGRYEHWLIKGGIGHNLPQEAPDVSLGGCVGAVGQCLANVGSVLTILSAYCFASFNSLAWEINCSAMRTASSSSWHAQLSMHS